MAESSFNPTQLYVPKIGRDSIDLHPFPSGGIVEGNHQYEIKEPIGKGADYYVYRATDQDVRDLNSLPKPVSIRVTRSAPENVDEQMRVAYLQAALARQSDFIPDVYNVFKKEVNIYDPDNLPKLFQDVNTEAREYNFVVEVQQLIDGPNLREALINHQLSASEIYQTLADAAEGVNFMHNLATLATGELQDIPLIIHRDIKPNNILVAHDRKQYSKLASAPNGVHGYLIDFGDTSNTSSDKYTPGHTPNLRFDPEFDRPTVSDDIWAMGATIYECLARESFVETDNIRALNNPFDQNKVLHEGINEYVPLTADVLPENLRNQVDELNKLFESFFLGDDPQYKKMRSAPEVVKLFEKYFIDDLQSAI